MSDEQCTGPFADDCPVHPHPRHAAAHELAALRAENARLRGALERGIAIVDKFDAADDSTAELAIIHELGAWAEEVKLARAALASPPAPTPATLLDPRSCRETSQRECRRRWPSAVTPIPAPRWVGPPELEPPAEGTWERRPDGTLTLRAPTAPVCGTCGGDDADWLREHGDHCPDCTPTPEPGR